MSDTNKSNKLTNSKYYIRKNLDIKILSDDNCDHRIPPQPIKGYVMLMSVIKEDNVKTLCDNNRQNLTTPQTKNSDLIILPMSKAATAENCLGNGMWTLVDQLTPSETYCFRKGLKLSISVWLAANKMLPVNGIIGSGATFNPSREKFMDTRSLEEISPSEKKLRRAFNGEVKVVRTIMSHVRIDAPIWVVIGNLRILAAAVFFGTRFVYHFLKAISHTYSELSSSTKALRPFAWFKV